MSNMITIKQPQILHLSEGSHIYYGGNQIWYPNRIQKLSGCGPTSASHILWYLARTRTEYKHFCDHAGSSPNDFLKLMEEVWNYVTPGIMGVNNTSIFAKGIINYSKEKGYELSCRVLNIPKLPINRPTFEKVSTFLIEALYDDLPIAFLNLSNGSLQNLESWHWVTLISFNKETGIARMYDQGRSIDIDIRLWLRTTLQGGGFITFENTF